MKDVHLEVTLKNPLNHYVININIKCFANLAFKELVSFFFLMWLYPGQLLCPLKAEEIYFKILIKKTVLLKSCILTSVNNDQLKTAAKVNNEKLLQVPGPYKILRTC